MVAATQFFPPADVPRETDADGGQALAGAIRDVAREVGGVATDAFAMNEAAKDAALEYDEHRPSSTGFLGRLPDRPVPVTMTGCAPHPSGLPLPSWMR